LNASSERNKRVSGLLKKLETRRTVVGVIGLGYVGLPLSREFTQGGMNVLGFDLDSSKIEKLNNGESYIGHIPTENISQIIDQKLFAATTDFTRLPEADCLIITVPTPLDANRQPDLQYVRRTARELALNLDKKKLRLVVLESTTYPGTTREVVATEMERFQPGTDYLLAYSPEREDPGRKNYTTRTIPKVVGGIDDNSTKAATLLYQAAVEKVVPVSSLEVAEASKILENTYRSVNIALVNEMKLLFEKMGINIWEVIEASSTKPFGFQPFYPGPGLGGHCIPIDPFYLSYKAREHGMSTRFIELAGEINCAMPEHVVGKVAEALNRKGRPVNGSKILVLGLAYKKDIEDVRESPSLEIISLLLERGADVSYNDPHVPRTHRMRNYDLEMESVPLGQAVLGRADAVLICTDHSAYDYEFIVENSSLVIDTRNATKDISRGREKIITA